MSDPLPEERSDEPITTGRIAADLRALGVEEGDTLLVHSSLSSLGWVPGGAPAVVDALRSVVTPAGTLVVPTHSPYLTDPRDWENPPVPESWYDTIRETMPPYRPEITPTWGMGTIPECFRHYPDAVRSAHPAHSFAAWGRDADAVVDGHALEAGLGDGSPLEGIYGRDGSVLLLGVGHDRNTSLHLAEHRADWAQPIKERGSPILVGTGVSDLDGEGHDHDGEREWVTYRTPEIDSDDFPDCGEAFEETHPDAVTTGAVGVADAILLDQRALVDFAVEWFVANRE